MSAKEERARDGLRETIEDLVRQFAYPTMCDGLPALTTGGLSALEGGFRALGWSDPHPCPEDACEIAGCGQWAMCIAEGKRLCGAHFREAYHA